MKRIALVFMQGLLRSVSPVFKFGLGISVLQVAIVPLAGHTKENVHYTTPQVYGMRPDPNSERALGPIGVTGIQVRIYKGLKVTVESTDAGTPAEGKFEKGDVILGVNGELLAGRNALVVLGKALTAAEAKDGKLTFVVKSRGEETNQEVTIKIPVLGAYSKTFPLKCQKSRKIIKHAAAFYASKDNIKAHTMWSGLACLFLLSTGDRKYVPRVKAYFSQYLKPDGTVKGLADHSWFNGYNGVACAEYYLRTGDKSVLPILQHYCDDARDRQKYGVGWGHWGYSVFPSYESGGGMQHAAGNQILLTLLLGKMCGVEVDNKTLVGALRHWYRFAGHGAFPVSDQRNYHVFRSAGRDGATAAVMHIASKAQGDVTIYAEARQYLAMSALTSWPERQYDWEVYWHSLAGHFTREFRPKLYYKTMRRFQWQYDLGRDAQGAFHWAHHAGSNKPTESGIALALAYTAPLKTLQITGAPRSRHAKRFKLPKNLWGTPADRAFLSVKHHEDFSKYGEEDEIHETYRKFPLRLSYHPNQTKSLPLNLMLKNVRHARYTVRLAAAKALCFNKHYGEIEKLLRDPDPRLRRAGLDGINDSRPWFTGPVVWQYALKAKDYTPATNQAITDMMADPSESWFVIDAALNALSHAPVPVLEKNIPKILPWLTHGDWWLRESAFMALMGLERDEKLFTRHLPTIINTMIKEYVYNPRHKMVEALKKALTRAKKESPVGQLILAGLTRATVESTVKSDVGKYPRSQEGLCNIVEVALALIRLNPEGSADLADTLAADDRLKGIDTGSLMRFVKSGDGHYNDRHIGLYPALKTLPPPAKKQLTDTLFNKFLPELIQRHKTAKKSDSRLLDMIVELTRLKKSTPGWQPVGAPKPANRDWRYLAFDPLKEKEKLHPRIGPPQRLRKVTLPAGTDNWFKPEFDDRKWLTGKCPIGVGVFKAHGHGRGSTYRPNFSYRNNSDWGDREFIMMRTTFELKDLDFDLYRISILADQGYHIYLNGHKIHTYIWFMHCPEYRKIMLTKKETQHLRKGTNTLAAFGVVRYRKDKKTETYHTIGQMDLWIDGLKTRDLGL